MHVRFPNGKVDDYMYYGDNCTANDFKRSLVLPLK